MTRKDAPFRRIPGEGAVWPATVIKGDRIKRSLFNEIIPATSKIQTLGVRASIHALSEPVPWSNKFVTRITVVWGGERWRPLPAVVFVPKPLAPGNAGSGVVVVLMTVGKAVGVGEFAGRLAGVLVRLGLVGLGLVGLGVALSTTTRRRCTVGPGRSVSRS